MEVSVNEEITRAVRSSGKAGVSDPGLLQTALLMCQLSAAVYDSDELNSWSSPLLEEALCPVSWQITTFSTRLVHASNASVGDPYQDLGRQYGIWEVDGVGLIVAFGGTQDAQDIIVDLDLQPMQLLTGPHIIHLHGGICKAAMLTCKDIASHCLKLCQGAGGAVKPLFLAGKLLYC